MQNAEILKKLRAAQLPVPAITKTTLPESGFSNLRQIIAGREFAAEDKLACYSLVAQGKLNSTLTRAALACALMGKELVLIGVKVHYTGLAGLLRYSGDRYFDESNPYASGEGYIIIPDFDDEVVIEGRPQQWRDALDLLTRHISYGGGVIIGKGNTELEFPGSNFALLYRDFTPLPINAAK